MEPEEGGEVPRTESKVKNVEIEALPYGGVSNVVVSKEFPPKCKDLSSFFISCMVGQVRIDKALCDLGTSVGSMPYFIVETLISGQLQPAPFSLQLADGFEKHPLGIL